MAVTETLILTMVLVAGGFGLPGQRDHGAAVRRLRRPGAYARRDQRLRVRSTGRQRQCTPIRLCRSIRISPWKSCVGRRSLYPNQGRRTSSFHTWTLASRRGGTAFSIDASNLPRSGPGWVRSGGTPSGEVIGRGSSARMRPWKFKQELMRPPTFRRLSTRTGRRPRSATYIGKRTAGL